MKAHDGAHSESQTVLPDPLAGAGIWNVGAFGLPAVMLSICSASVFAVVLIVLRIGAARELFLLRFPGTPVIAAAATAISWLVAMKCRSRPGRLWPRIWALALAVLNSAILVLSVTFHDRSWALALAVAGLAAAATLAPRLIKLRPDSPMVQWMAPLSFLMILLFVLPMSCVVRRTITSSTADRVEQRIQQFRLRTLVVKEASAFDWSRLEETPDAAAAVIGKLEQLQIDGEVDDVELWRSAAILGKDAELAAAMGELTTAVVAALAPERVPRVSNLREAAVRWDHQEKRWERSTSFPRLSELTGAYYNQLGRLFGQLASQHALGTNPRLVDYQEYYAAQRALLKNHLDAVAKTWSDNWAPFKVPQHQALLGRTEASLRELLRAPFVESEEGTFAPGHLWQLTSVPLSSLKAMAAGSPGCEGGDLGANEPPRARGCHCRRFDEGERQYFRLDCYSYMPQKQGTGAELRVEMRLVYQSEAGRRLPPWSVPVEIYFHFLIPEGVNGDAFREAVMAELSSAARQFLPEGRIRTDRGGSTANGFDLEVGSGSVRALRPAVVTLTGLTPESQALVVRVVRTPTGWM